ncbi:inositol monophosphatase [Fulvivirga sp. 29W222]|uniref:Inositol monophosphatase n=1 Tax=Fulvivirga marina TaxID=2494733 RepID=A0A937FT13_9BACT|nr:inositol monophosphatase family protein [Fulvivirga marina]MBL6444759.1 inositol monophosphatase [Fulvivirga marina]
MDFYKSFLELKLVVRSNLKEVLRLRNKRMSKEDKSFVTEGDLLINKWVKEIFEKNIQQYHFVSEETDSHMETEAEGVTIVLDPIDGTENFTSGLPEWGISLSCYNDGVHCASMLACPEMDIWICSGDVVEKNYSRIRGLSSSLSMDELIKATQGHEYRILGCCVYNMINVIRGSYLSFENPKGANSWDILAGLNLALENDLIVMVNGKHYNGEYLQPNRKYKFKVENR